LENIKNLRIINLIHNKSERKIKNIFNPLYYYKNIKGLSSIQIRKSTINLNFELTEDFCGIPANILNQLKKTKIDYFFHLAAVSDFNVNDSTFNKLNNNNVDGTKKVIELLKILDIKQLIYTGTAYSHGSLKGTILPYTIQLNSNFRNYYEQTKLIAEDLIIKYALQNNIKYKVFRPVGICGRLLEEPTGYFVKYDLFYGWALFFFKLKTQYFKNITDALTKPLNINIRIACNRKGGLNFIPVDLAARLMWIACNNSNETSFHLNNKYDVNNIQLLETILNALNIQGVQFVNKKPNDLNKTESLYYRSVGKVFTPYLLLDSVKFHDNNLNILAKEHSISFPKFNQKNINELVNFILIKLQKDE